jgi:hypothetical protein
MTGAHSSLVIVGQRPPTTITPNSFQSVRADSRGGSGFERLSMAQDQCRLRSAGAEVRRGHLFEDRGILRRRPTAAVDARRPAPHGILKARAEKPPEAAQQTSARQRQTATRSQPPPLRPVGNGSLGRLRHHRRQPHQHRPRDGASREAPTIIGILSIPVTLAGFASPGGNGDNAAITGFAPESRG